MIWKVVYDFERRFWITFGHVLYVDAATKAEADALGRAAAEAAEPGAVISRLVTMESNEGARAKHLERVRALEVWKQNAAAGRPNDPKSV